MSFRLSVLSSFRPHHMEQLDSYWTDLNEKLIAECFSKICGGKSCFQILQEKRGLQMKAYVKLFLLR